MFCCIEIADSDQIKRRCHVFCVRLLVKSWFEWIWFTIHPEQWHYPMYPTSWHTTWVNEWHITWVTLTARISTVQWARPCIIYLLDYNSDDWQGCHQRQSEHIYCLVSGGCNEHGSVLTMSYSMSVTLISRLMLNLHKSIDTGIFSTATQNDEHGLAVFTTKISLNAESRWSSLRGIR